MPGDPIGNGERFAITGTYPDELKLSTIYPGAQIIYKYHLSSTTVLGNVESEEELRAYYYKEGKEYDGVWPMIPAAPDSAAAGRYVGAYHASVYFAFQFSYITDPAIRANVLNRALNWLTTVTTTSGRMSRKRMRRPRSRMGSPFRRTIRTRSIPSRRSRSACPRTSAAPPSSGSTT